jgi:hypothetical protein
MFVAKRHPQPKGEKTMSTISILSHFGRGNQVSASRRSLFSRRASHLDRPDLHQLAQDPSALPRFVQQCPVAMRHLHLLGPLHWGNFPERDLQTNWGAPVTPYTPFVAAYLVKLEQKMLYLSHLRQYLVEHPALTWILGFPLVPSSSYSWGFDVDASLPSQRHLARMLRKVPNSGLQFLLDDTIELIKVELPKNTPFGDTVSMDTKHVIAFVQENNSKAYVKDRYDKTKQPAGDPDCRLGCKRRRNQVVVGETPETPLSNPVPASTLSVGEYYWGYGSGIVATKVPEWGEFVLAELTQPFDCGDLSYFFPLMADVKRRLGFRPRFGAFDAAFDAWYVYEYFDRGDRDLASGFAAVPFSQKGGYGSRKFDQDGLPLCQAGLSMPLKGTFQSNKGLVPHEQGTYACPLYFPESSGKPCPIQHEAWAKGGCTTRMATSVGARIRYELDRESELYKEIYRQRTASERIYAQAMEFGIERPRLRNGLAITNQNTLTYVLINLHGLHRIRDTKHRSES